MQGDVADAGAVLAEGFDGVLHFAARSLVGESMTNPQLYWLGNVVSSVRLLEAVREHGTPRLVFSSTAIGSYAAAHGVRAVSLRYFNVAGAYGRHGERHTTETHLIPLVLQVA